MVKSIIRKTVPCPLASYKRKRREYVILMLCNIRIAYFLLKCHISAMLLLVIIFFAVFRMH
jgi:hypothetical protein